MKKIILAGLLVSLLSGCSTTQQVFTIPSHKDTGLEPIEILITQDHKTAWRKRSPGGPGHPYTPVERNALAQTIFSELKPGQTVVIAANGTIRYDAVMRIAEDLRKIGVMKIGFLVDQTGNTTVSKSYSGNEVIARAAKDQALMAMMRGDVLSAAGLPGGTADRNQSGGGRDDGYGAKVRACVQPGVSFPPPPRGSAGNPAAQYRVSLKPDGQIADVRMTKSSGNTNFDRAVETGIRRCTPFPRPSTGSYPGYIDVNYNMYD
jgi:TonB family protein